jgi:hypothetical protein
VLIDTAEGLLVTVKLQIAQPTPYESASILLKGVHGAGITLDDLLV